MGDNHLSELCRGTDIHLIEARLRQYAPSAENAATGDNDLYDPAANVWAFQDEDGRTAFHWAVAMKNFSLGAALMESPYNTPVLTEDKEHGTPFAAACNVGAPQEFLVQLLAKSVEHYDRLMEKKKAAAPPPAVPAAAASGAEKNLEDLIRGVPPLSEAIPTAEVAVVNSVDDLGNTPLLMAVSRGNSRIVRFLLEKGADLGCQNDRGQSALHRAVSRGNMDLVEFLVTASEKKQGGKNVQHRRWMDLQDYHGDSALFYASLENNEEAGRFLLRHGADRDLRNKNNKQFWEV